MVIKKFILLFVCFALSLQSAFASGYSSAGGVPATYPGQTSIVTLGTITTGTWTATPLGASYIPALSAISGTLTAGQLPNTAVTPGSYTYGGFTVDAQGRLTAASSGTAPTAYGGFRNQTAQTVTSSTVLTSSSAAATLTNQSGATSVITLPQISTAPNSMYWVGGLDTGGGATTKTQVAANAADSFEDGNTQFYPVWQPSNRAGALVLNDGTYWHIIPELRAGGISNSNRGGSVVYQLAASGGALLAESVAPTATGQILTSTSNAVGFAGISQGTSGFPLISAGTGANPAFAQLNIASGTNVSGILAIANGGTANIYGNGEMTSSFRNFAWQCPSNVSTTMKGQGIADMGTNWSVNNNLVYTARQGIQCQTAVTTSDRGYFNSDNLIQTQQKPVMVGWIVPNTGSIGRLNWGLTVNQTNCLDATYTNSAVIVWDQGVGGNYLFKHGTTSDDLGVAPSNGVINDFVIDFSDGTNFKVYIDGTLRLTTSTDLPTSTTYLMVLAGIKNLTLANAARSEMGIGRIAIKVQ